MMSKDTLGMIHTSLAGLFVRAAEFSVLHELPSWNMKWDANLFILISPSSQGEESYIPCLVIVLDLIFKVAQNCCQIMEFAL